jgi:acetyl-CoA carboxylase carboxyltransferase component
MPSNYANPLCSSENSLGTTPQSQSTKSLQQIIPVQENIAFDIYEAIDTLIDKDSFFEIKRLYAPEIVTGFARLGGMTIGIVANQPKVKGGVLFVDSADKASRFVWLCDAFSIPLLFLADVPGFMIGTKVEQAGIIRSGAKMVSAVATASVPKISVILRKAYGAGLYAMCGPGLNPDACLALPTAWIAVMGPEAAVNAVYYNKIMELPESERPAYIEKLRTDYKEDVDIFKLGAEMVIDNIIEPDKLREELIARFKNYSNKKQERWPKKCPVLPV